MTTYRLAVAIEKGPDGYFGFCPALQGCDTRGETYEEVLANLKDAMRLHVDDRLEAGEAISQPESVALTSLDVAV